MCHVASAGLGAGLYIVLYHVVLRRLPRECRMGRLGHMAMMGLAVLLMTVQPVWAMARARQCWLAAMTVCTLLVVVTELTCFWIPDEATLLLVLSNGVAYWQGLTVPDLGPQLLVIGFFVLLYGLFPQGMGSGDVKLAAALSLSCTAGEAFGMVSSAFFIGAAAGTILWFWRRQVVLPFGPCLLAGWWSALWKISGWEWWMAWIGV